MPDRPDAWQEGPSLPEERRRLEAGVAALGARLVVIGGFATSDREVPRLEITREVLVLETLTGDWLALPDAPVAWTHPAVAGIGGSIYLLGGLATEAFTARGEVFVLEPGASLWRERAPMPEGLARGAAGVVVTRGHVFLLGGATSDGVTASCLDYQPTSDSWTVLPDLPVARSHAAATRTDDGTLIVAGGIGAQGEPLGDVYALPPPPLLPGDWQWELREPMPTARGGCAYGDVYGQLVCAGGEAGDAVLRVTESYDPTLDTWTALPELPVDRAGAPGAVIGQRLFVVGGSQTRAFEPTSNVLVFSLLDTIETRSGHCAGRGRAEELGCAHGVPAM
ncbi:MAG: hypothetical protein H0X17_25370 [Deltaproteobacteria bacterium]|nr:hypothetical protein [Deltaproteobacteria bacterium]